jgi:hypothetical protein
MKYLYTICFFACLIAISGCKNNCSSSFFKGGKLSISDTTDTFISLKRTTIYNNQCCFYTNIAGMTPIEELDKQNQKYPYFGGKNGFLCETNKEITFIHEKTQKRWLLFDFKMKENDERQIKDPFSKGYFMPINADSLYTLYCKKINYDKLL